MCFIHYRLSRLYFAFRRDIVNYKDIQLLFFFNRGRCQFFINVYSDSLHKFSKKEEWNSILKNWQMTFQALDYKRKNFLDLNDDMSYVSPLIWKLHPCSDITTSPPSTAAIFLATHLTAVLQPSRYSVFHGGNTPIRLSLPWWSYSSQCLNTETSAQSNRGYTTETLSISYSKYLYIRLVVTL